MAAGGRMHAKRRKNVHRGQNVAHTCKTQQKCASRGTKLQKWEKEACERSAFSPFGDVTPISVGHGVLCGFLGLRMLADGPRVGAARKVAWRSMLAAAAAPSPPSRRVLWRPFAKCAQKGGIGHSAGHRCNWCHVRGVGWHRLRRLLMVQWGRARVPHSMYLRVPTWPVIVWGKVVESAR